MMAFGDSNKNNREKNWVMVGLGDEEEGDFLERF